MYPNYAPLVRNAPQSPDWQVRGAQGQLLQMVNLNTVIRGAIPDKNSPNVTNNITKNLEC